MNLFETLKQFYYFKKEKKQPVLQSIDTEHEKGATEVFSDYGGIISQNSEYFKLPTSEITLIKTYRSLSKTSDVDLALNEIRNEIFIFDVPGKKAIEISFDDTKENKLSVGLIKKIREEYNTVYNLLDFDRKGLEYFDSWYIDGRLFLHKIIEKNKPKNGIQKIIQISPFKIRRIVEYPNTDEEGVYDLNKIKIYYLFSDINDVYNNNRYYNNQNRLNYMVLSKEVITYIDSGIYDEETGAPLSHLWKTIIPYNNMKMMEEALLIYRVVRSPERRVFYIDIGNLSKAKAEQYMQNLMNRFKNKLIYDQTTGRMVDQKHIMSMAEDYWLPRGINGKGTEIQSLPGATNLGSVEDVELFRKRFYDSTNVVASRFQDDNQPTFQFGRTSDISRDEYRFKKMLSRLRNRFIMLFEDLLKTQLILKNIITENDWDTIKKSIVWQFTEDNNFVEWKETEILNNRLDSLNNADNYVGKYWDKVWVLKNIMKMSDDEIKKLLEDSKKDAEYYDNDNDYYDRDDDSVEKDDSEDKKDSENDSEKDKEQEEDSKILL